MAHGCTLVRLVVSVLCGLVVDDKDLIDTYQQMGEALAHVTNALKAITVALGEHDNRITVLEAGLGIVWKETK